jgi:hypothetical protein
MFPYLSQKRTMILQGMELIFTVIKEYFANINIINQWFWKQEKCLYQGSPNQAKWATSSFWFQ